MADTLARAFAPYDFVRAALPGERFAERLRELYAVFADLALRMGEAWVAGDGAAAAIWQPPGRPPADDPEAEARVHELLGTGLERYLVAARLIAEHRPERPHYYLDVLGTDPEHQGAGLGGAVLAPVLARCDAERLPALTDTSAPENLPFYERQGFALLAEYDEPDGGPRVWVLERAPT